MTDGTTRDPKLVELQETVAALREAGTKKSNSITLLKERIEKLKAVAGGLKETVERLKARNADLAASLEDARRRIVESRHDPRSATVREHNSVEGMDSFFSENSETVAYLEFADTLRQQFDALGLSVEGRDFFDAGVGPGYLLRRFLTGLAPASFGGCDFSAVAVGQAQEIMPEGAFYVASLYDPLQASHDVILCTEVLEHMDHPEIALHHIVEALRPRGFAYVTVPDGRVDYSGLHINFWSPESWTIFVTKTCPGLEITTGTFKARPTSRYLNNFALIRR